MRGVYQAMEGEAAKDVEGTTGEVCRAWWVRRGEEGEVGEEGGEGDWGHLRRDLRSDAEECFRHGGFHHNTTKVKIRVI